MRLLQTPSAALTYTHYFATMLARPQSVKQRGPGHKDGLIFTLLPPKICKRESKSLPNVDGCQCCTDCTFPLRDSGLAGSAL